MVALSLIVQEGPLPSSFMKYSRSHSLNKNEHQKVFMKKQRSYSREFLMLQTRKLIAIVASATTGLGIDSPTTDQC